MGKQNPILLRQPLQNLRVISSSDFCILNPNDVNMRSQPPNQTKNIVIEVFVCG